MIDFTLTEEQQLLQKTARDFAQREIRPVAEAVRRAKTTNPWALCRDVFVKGSELGFTRLLIPEQFGGLGGTCVDNVLLMEELGAADVGVAASYFGLSASSPRIILGGGTPAQHDYWLRKITASNDFVIGSAAGEPNVAGADSYAPLPDPNIGIKTTAKRVGDKYVLRGTKSGFSTNAGAAKLYLIMARTDLTRPAFQSTAMFLVPADTPGLRVGAKTQLIGWHAAMHAEVYLEDVEVPADYKLGEEGMDYGRLFMSALPYLGSGLAACYVGLARAAFEYAFEYAQQRVSWGKPIIQHQAVALKLADMLADLESARTLVWRCAAAADRGDIPAAMVLAPAAKTLAVDVAIRNAQRAVKILGAYGVAAEYEAGRFLTDAWIGEACDGTHDLLRLNMLTAYQMSRGGPPPGSLPDVS